MGGGRGRRPVGAVLVESVSKPEGAIIAILDPWQADRRDGGRRPRPRCASTSLVCEGSGPSALAHGEPNDRSLEWASVREYTLTTRTSRSVGGQAAYDQRRDVLELDLNLTAEQALDECRRRGLVVRSERELAGRAGSHHWHLRIPGRRGTLELNEWESRVWVNVHPLRDGGWASALAHELSAAGNR